MQYRPLQAVSGLDPLRLFDSLAEAVHGRGPALLPIAADTPPARSAALLATLRPATLRTPEGVTRLSGGRPVREDTALVIATSGSTGRPKGVELSGAALLNSARASSRRIGATAADSWLCILPTSHISGLQVLLRALVNGAAPIPHERFDVDAVLAEAARSSPHVSLVPTQLRRLLAAHADLSAFGTFVLGGAAADERLLAEARAAGARVVTTYGMSETSGGCVYDGVPLDGVEIDISDDGRIRIRGDVLFSGYRLDDAPTSRPGHWFATSDLGAFDPEGRLRVRGRVDDVINTGGHKVVAGEVTALLVRHPAVADAAVVGRDDDEWGQCVTAVIVARDPARPPALRELKAWVRASLPDYAAPRGLEVREALPLLASGKPDLAELRKAPNPPRNS